MTCILGVRGSYTSRQKNCGKTKTIIIVTYEKDFAREVADKVIFMADGTIVEQGTATEVLDHPQNPGTR